MKLGWSVVVLVMLSLSAFAQGYWADESSRDEEGNHIFYGKSSIIKSESLQIRILEIDGAKKEVKATLVDGKGNIATPNALLTEKSYATISDGKVRVKVAGFRTVTSEAGYNFYEVAFEVGILVNAEFIKVNFPKRMEVGVLYSAEVDVSNTGHKTQEFYLTSTIEKPFVDVSTNIRKVILNPILATQKLQVSVQPLEAMTDGEVTLNIVYDGAIVTSTTVTGITVMDNSQGFINSIDLPKVMYRNQKYKGKIQFTNNADVQATVKIRFQGEGFDVDTKSRYGSNVLAELLGPHITKYLEFPITPIKAGKQMLVVEMYSNERIVDKVNYEIQVNNYVPDEVLPEEEVVQEISVEQEIAPVEQPIEQPVQQEEVTLPTAQVVAQVDSPKGPVLLRVAGVVLALLLSVLIYNKYVKRDETPQPPKKKQTKKATTINGVRKID